MAEEYQVTQQDEDYYRDLFDNEIDANQDQQASADEIIKFLRRTQNPTKSEVRQIIEDMGLHIKGSSVTFAQFCYYMNKYTGDHPDPQSELAQAFECLDKDKSGYLEVNELWTMLSNNGEEPLTEEEFEEFMSFADKDNDGRINYNEFSNYIMQARGQEQ